jgi:hypothetical protein
MGRKSRKLLLDGIFCEEFFYETSYVLFGFFPKYYIIYHDSMRWISIFWFFWTTFAPISNLNLKWFSEKLIQYMDT